MKSPKGALLTILIGVIVVIAAFYALVLVTGWL